jgi:hypothetical protein
MNGNNLGLEPTSCDTKLSDLQFIANYQDLGNNRDQKDGNKALKLDEEVHL